MPEKGFVIVWTQFIDDKTLVKNMNGSTLGSTLVAQAESPDRELFMKIAGEIIMQIKK